MKNKRGFTLVEILATIVLLGIILLIAVPSISTLQEKANIRQIQEDAKVFVELVRQKIESDTSIIIPTSKTFYMSDIDKSKLSSEYTSGAVEASNCGYDDTTDIYECTNFHVVLENDNYKAEGNVDDDSINIIGSKK